LVDFTNFVAGIGAVAVDVEALARAERGIELHALRSGPCSRIRRDVAADHTDREVRDLRLIIADIGARPNVEGHLAGPELGLDPRFEVIDQFRLDRGEIEQRNASHGIRLARR
jgi:hypothetical protein